MYAAQTIMQTDFVCVPVCPTGNAQARRDCRKGPFWMEII